MTIFCLLTRAWNCCLLQAHPSLRKGEANTFPFLLLVFYSHPRPKRVEAGCQGQGNGISTSPTTARNMYAAVSVQWNICQCIVFGDICLTAVDSMQLHQNGCGTYTCNVQNMFNGIYCSPTVFCTLTHWLYYSQEKPQRTPVKCECKVSALCAKKRSLCSHWLWPGKAFATPPAWQV